MDGLTASPGDAVVNLSWNSLEGAEEYKIYISDEEPGTSASNTYAAQNLTNGVRYTFQVAGVNEAGEGPKSGSVTSIPRPLSLGQPDASSSSSAELQPGDTEALSVTLRWSEIEQATEYRIYRSDAGGASVKEAPIATLQAADAEETSYSDTDVTDGGVYIYEVEAAMVVDGEEILKSERGTYTGQPRRLVSGQAAITLDSIDNTNDQWHQATVTITTVNAGIMGVAIPGSYKLQIYNARTEGNLTPFKTTSGGTAATSATITAGTDGSATQTLYELPYALLRFEAVPIFGAMEDTDKKSSVISDAPARRALEISGTLTATADQATNTITLKWNADADGRITHYQVTRLTYRTGETEPVREVLDRQPAAFFDPPDDGGTVVPCCQFTDSSLAYNTYDYTVTPYVVIGMMTDYEGTEKQLPAQIELTPPPEPEQVLADLTYYADPFAFTGQSTAGYKGGTSSGTFDVRAHPGAAWPFGMTQMTPVNARVTGAFSGATDGGKLYYVYRASERTTLKAFATSFITGPGCQIGLEFVFMAQNGQVSRLLGSSTNDPTFTIRNPYAKAAGTSPDTKRADKDRIEKEYAEPGYYRVNYYSGTNTTEAITAEFTTTPRTGMGKFTFPASAAHATFQLTTFSGSIVSLGKLEALSRVSNAIALELEQGKFCNQGKKNKMYAVILFNRTISGVPANAISDNITLVSDGKTIKAASGNVQVELGTNKVVQIKVGRSSISAEKAYANIVAENKTDASTQASPVMNWNFEDFRTKAKNKWNKVLNQILIEDGDKNHRLEEKRIFYSALYQASLHPNIFDDHDGKYRGFDQRVHTVDTDYQEHQYQNYSGWDTYRGQHQLISLLDKKLARDIAQSLINNANQAGCPATGACEETGIFTRWGHHNQDTLVMNGDPGTILVASSLAYGGTGFNYDDAYKIMLRAGYGTFTYDVGPAPDHQPRSGSTDVSNSKGGSRNTAIGGGNNKGLRQMRRVWSADTGGRITGWGNHAKVLTNLGAPAPIFPITDIHEFSASDFARAQYIKIVKEIAPANMGAKNSDGSRELTDAEYKSKYEEILNHAGDTWRKAYSWYRKRNTDTPVRDIAGRNTSSLNTAPIRLQPIVGLSRTNHPNSVSKYNDFKSLIDHWNVSSNMDYREGVAEHYRWMIPFDIAGLFKWLGSETVENSGFAQNEAQYTALRNFIHGQDHYNAGEDGHTFNLGNQPCYSVAWVPNYLGYPHFAQVTIRRIMNFTYDDMPNYSMAGNDDLGSLSSQYVWTSIGLYPAHPGLGILHVTTPRFKKVTVRNNEGILLTSEAESTGTNNCSDSKDYNHKCFLIDSMQYNGENYTKTYIRYWKDIAEHLSSGGLRLKFNVKKLVGTDGDGNPEDQAIGSIDSTGNFVPGKITSSAARYAFLDAFKNSQPSTNWGRKLSDLPPSGSGGFAISVGFPLSSISSAHHDQFNDFAFAHKNY